MEKLIKVFIGIIIVFCFYTMCIWMPVNLYSEAECLKAGYPKNKVSIGLESYCLTLDGVVTVMVEKQ